MRLRKKGRTGSGEADAADASRTSQDLLATGPIDVGDVDLEEDPVFAGHVDLGGLVVAAPFDGADLRLQIDDQSGDVLAVLLAGEDGALELRAFSSSRSEAMWPEVREAMRAEAESHGGETSERTGTWGTELECRIPVELPDGQSGTQPSRVIGIEGGRWFLRATLLGRPAMEPDDAQEWEAAIRSTVVRRGREAMPPGEPIPLRLPPELEEQLREQQQSQDES